MRKKPQGPKKMAEEVKLFATFVKLTISDILKN